MTRGGSTARHLAVDALTRRIRHITCVLVADGDHLLVWAYHDLLRGRSVSKRNNE